MPKANPKGNPNPSPDTRFGGARGNPNGKTSEQKRLEIENAERAVRIRSRGLMAIEAMLEGMEDPEAVSLLVDAAMLKLLKDSEDRGLGAPVQALQHTGADGGPVRFTKAEELTDDQLAAIAAGKA